jgi:adenine specific DNA methylase Mod
MHYKKTRITVKRTDPKKNPNLYEHLPYTFKTSDGSIWLYREDELIHKVAECLVYNSSKFIVLKNKIPEEGREKILRKTLDELVKGHNLAVELGLGGKNRCLKKAKKILKKLAEE